MWISEAAEQAGVNVQTLRRRVWLFPAAFRDAV
jgi:hypothetical protein